MEDILEVFKQVKINLPLLNAIQQIPLYAKFLKDLCTHKHKLRNHFSIKVFLTEKVSSIVQNTPPKYKDLGTPTTLCLIDDTADHRALLYLGSSVSLLPYSIYEQFRLGDLQPTSLTLQLADRSVKVARGIIEDILVKVDTYCYPIDFIVFDMEPVSDSMKHILVILGHPFLATANAIINCHTRVMDIDFGN